MKNWLLKLGSLIASIFLAVFVNYFFTPTDFGSSVVQLIAPVEIRNVPENKSVIWPATRQVELTVQGSSLFMSRVALSPPVVRVNLPEGADKSFIAKLNADNVNLPATVRLLGIKPSELEFGLDNIVERTVPVVVPQIGMLVNELNLERVKIDPSEVILKGPSRELKNAINIETNPINLGTIDHSVEMNLELRTPWSTIESNIKNVRVVVEVSDAIGDLGFLNVPVLLEVQKDSMKNLNPRAAQKGVSVLLRGSKRILKNIKKENLIVRAQISSESQLSDLVELTLDPIESIDSVVISPRKIGILVDSPILPTVAVKKPILNKLPETGKKSLPYKGNN